MDLNVPPLLSMVLAEWRNLGISPANLHPALWFTPKTLPVVGLDAVDVQDTLFALRAADQDGRGIADAWLRAVQCAQLAHDRILRDLHDVDRNLAFWQQRLTAGGHWSHGSFMLLSRGPLSFAEDVVGAARRLQRLVLVPQQQQQQEQKQPLGEARRTEGAARPSTRPAAGLAAASSASGGSGGMQGSGVGASEDASSAGATATDMMQQRVLLLRALRLRLARSLAQLTEAAAGLRVGGLLDIPAAEPCALAAVAVAGMGGFAAAGAVSGLAGQGPSTSQGQLQVVEAVVRSSIWGMLAALEGLLSYRPLQPHHHSHSDGHKGSEQRGLRGGQQPQADKRSLSLELQKLLDVLRLQPLAVRALGLSYEPPAEVQQQPAEAARGAAAAAEASAGCPASGLQVVSGGGSAKEALDAAKRVAALSGPLVALPPSARMPSRFQRHWLRYCAAAGVVLYGGLFLLRHSRLAGSDDLDRWILAAASAVRSALRTHVAEPLAAVRDELFRTFRDRPAIVSAGDFTLSRESLLRMLADFAADHTTTATASTTATTTASSHSAPQQSASQQQPAVATLPDAAGAGGESDGSGEDEAVASGMTVLMRSYEGELRRPLRNLLLGDLARALLIQVQHVKVDGEAAMLRLDQILRANELSISLMAALPALGISLAAAAGLARLLIPRAPDRRRQAVPSRLAMAALEVALTQLAAAEDEEGRGGQLPLQRAGSQAAAAAAAAVEELRGLVAYRLSRVYCEVTALYATADRTSRYSEWRQLHEDLLRLAALAPALERLAAHQRMMRTYSVFQR